MKNYRNHRIFLRVACCLLFLAGLSLPSKTVQAQPPQKATWLWNASLIKDSSESILSFADANGINVFYVQMNRDVKPEYYKSFIRQATARSMEVHALGGAPNWSLESERYRVDAFIKWTTDYQNAAAPSERFKGIHFDIEPHVLSQWKTDQASVIAQWQSSISYLVDGLRPLNLPVTADIPFWLHKYNLPDKSASMSRWLISKVDAVAIMAYRDQAANIYNLAATELKEADDLGKKAVIAVETKQSSEGAFITFYEESAEFMDRQLQLVETMAADHASFSGFAIHEYNSYRALVEKGN